MSHNGINGWAMGFGGLGILFWVVLVPAVVALATYRFSKPGGRL